MTISIRQSVVTRKQSCIRTYRHEVSTFLVGTMNQAYSDMAWFNRPIRIESG